MPRTDLCILIMAGLLLMLGVVAGCDDKEVPPDPNRPKPNLLDPSTFEAVDKTKHKFNYLALGDSYTIGQSVMPEERFPVQLAARLRKHDIDIGNPKIIARTGWTTQDLLLALDKSKPAGTYDLVTILIGVNNQYQGKSIEEYRTELADLLKRSVLFAGGDASHVIGFSIPDYGVTPFGHGDPTGKIGPEIDAFNKVMAEECAKLNIVLIDISPISRTVPEHPELITVDGLHPSPKQYKAWVAAGFPAVMKIFGGQAKEE